VIGEVSDGLDAVQKVQELQPDLILLDIGLPTLNGIEVARRVRTLAPECRIIFVSMESSAEVVQEALSVGAWGYVVKPKTQSDLLPAVEAAISSTPSGDVGLTASGVTCFLPRPTGGPVSPRDLDRARDVTCLQFRGSGGRQCAGRAAIRAYPSSLSSPHFYCSSSSRW
jgi:CheY-like chemotaxis protein